MSIPIRQAEEAQVENVNSPNNIVIADNEPFRIVDIRADCFIGEKWEIIEDLFIDPLPSRAVGIFKVSMAYPCRVRRTAKLEKAMVLSVRGQEHVMKLCHQE